MTSPITAAALDRSTSATPGADATALPATSEFHALSDHEQSYLDHYCHDVSAIHDLTARVHALQAHMRVLRAQVQMLVDAELRPYHAAATVIQAHWRGYRVRKRWPGLQQTRVWRAADDRAPPPGPAPLMPLHEARVHGVPAVLVDLWAHGTSVAIWYAAPWPMPAPLFRATTRTSPCATPAVPTLPTTDGITAPTVLAHVDRLTADLAALHAQTASLATDHTSLTEQLSRTTARFDHVDAAHSATARTLADLRESVTTIREDLTHVTAELAALLATPPADARRDVDATPTPGLADDVHALTLENAALADRVELQAMEIRQLRSALAAVADRQSRDHAVVRHAAARTIQAAWWQHRMRKQQRKIAAVRRTAWTSAAAPVTPTPRARRRTRTTSSSSAPPSLLTPVGAAAARVVPDALLSPIHGTLMDDGTGDESMLSVAEESFLSRIEEGRRDAEMDAGHVVSVEDFNYLKAEVEWLRNMVESMQAAQQGQQQRDAALREG
ncbi:hypothetical protein AMAG_07144 [Allomyces macrogynus ATCC 38327]|uniref:Uncharacterized protein n=1 Tax=Allomyces macrogynus (strain ATCC 38327) TaxID=578462 RepID=A0A0L0SHE5_ALLM3|nr:hypothetical protein AMAG_07144 [Allomyces macrogynus ATCC 38327]|eukprot:KNE61872.1 hypothetical protein AMAG_07144 [Allomyces macrogynus ATCC 38327]